MAEGASALAAASAETPEQLARRVASPGGTTEAGLGVLDAERRAASAGPASPGGVARGAEMAEMARLNPR